MGLEHLLKKMAGFTLLFKYLTENFIFDLNSIMINAILDFSRDEEN